MEDALREKKTMNKKTAEVLILIVMEDALRAYLKAAKLLAMS